MQSERTRTRKIVDASIVLLFLAGLWLPLSDNLFGIDPTPRLEEKRFLTPFPQVKWEHDAVERWPAQFESFFDDHLGWRDFLVRLSYLIRVKYLGVSTINPTIPRTTIAGGRRTRDDVAQKPRRLVVVGKNGWLFNGEQIEIDDYRGTRSFDQRGLESWRRALAERQSWAEQRGIRYVFMIAPNKSTIYPEYMPSQIRKVSDVSGLDRFYEYLKKHSRVNVVDLRPALLEAKKQDRIYEITGTHWNGLGAYLAYREVMTRLAGGNHLLDPRPLRDFSIQHGEGKRDLAMLIGLADLMPEPTIELVPQFARRARLVSQTDWSTANAGKPSFVYETGDPRLPKALMFHDSFGIPLKEFLAEHFQRLTMYCNRGFSPEIVEAEKPDVVLEELVERTAMGMIPENPPEISRSAQIAATSECARAPSLP